MIEQVLNSRIIDPAANPAYKASDFSDRIMRTQVTRLIEGSGFGGLVGFIMAILWVVLLWDKLPHVVLSVWLGAMAFLFVGRTFITYSRIYDPARKRSYVDFARRWYVLAVLITGACWGVTSMLMFPYDRVEQIVLAFILAGVAASGVTLSNVAWVYSGFVGLALVPLMVRLFYIGGEVKAPGGYPYNPGLTIQQAITVAGGPTEWASKNKFQILREGARDPIDADNATVVRPGDTVTVLEGIF